MILLLACVAAPTDTGAPPAPAPDTEDTTPPTLCAAWRDRIEVELPWGTGEVYTRELAGGFGPDTVLVGRVVVPETAQDSHGAYGGAYVAEYDGPATWRDIRLSRFPCDFRDVDETGEAGPISAGAGTAAAAFFTVGSTGGPYPALQPGEVWYVNVRNWNPDTGKPSCARPTCDAVFTVNPP